MPKLSSVDDFIRFLYEKANGNPQPGVMFTRTYPRLLKKSRIDKSKCPWEEGVVKVSQREVIFGSIYEKEVNEQRKREGHTDYFEPYGLWPSKEFPEGAGIRDTHYTVIHQGTGARFFAVQACIDKVTHEIVSIDKFFDKSSGIQIDTPELAGYLSVPSVSQRQQTDQPIVWRVISTESVTSAKVLGKTFNFFYIGK